jgi:hypothetical protein
MTTTAEIVTDDQIRKLREEALAAGDSRTVTSCDVALSSRDDSNAEGAPLFDDDGEPTTRTAQREILADAINAARAADDSAEPGP